MKAIRIIVDGRHARYNPAPDQRKKNESASAFLTRIASEVGGEVVEESAIQYPASPYRLLKTAIIERMTDAELDEFEAAMAQAPTRQRLMWANCLQVESSDAFFPALSGAMGEAFGQTRAAEILAAE